MSAKAVRKVRKKKEKKNVPAGIAHILATFSNTIVTITDPDGNTLVWSSSGVMGFKGSRKSTPYAAQTAVEDACKKVREYGMHTIQIYVKGPGNSRESALRAFASSGLHVTLIRDVTPIPHNGCRPPKRRRV
ncbi:MAG: 30S ribosomal protein S11 [Deltaproteobacteria bacterium]|jgi:small subunit ribosomal protein S11|nr:30S ribosomal protein S11 [Deltaproteobacteria bacterium]